MKRLCTAATCALAISLHAPGFGQTPPHSSSTAHAVSTQAQDQSGVALKQSVQPIAASNQEVKAALAATDSTKAAALTGKTATVQGVVAETYSPANHGVTILDLSKDWRHTITVAAFPASYSKLPDLKKLQGQHVLATGQVMMHDGQPQIVITSSTQIRIIK